MSGRVAPTPAVLGYRMWLPDAIDEPGQAFLFAPLPLQEAWCVPLFLLLRGVSLQDQNCLPPPRFLALVTSPLLDGFLTLVVLD